MEFDCGEHQGNLSPTAQQAVMRRVKAVLEEQLQYRVVQTTLDSNSAFWYPYLGTTAGNLVFCRVIVNDAPFTERFGTD